MEKRHLNVMIDAELYEKLKALAIKKHRKLRGVCEVAPTRWCP